MNRKKKIALGLVVCLSVGGVGTYFGGREILKHRIATWRVEGIAAAKAGDNERAADLLVRYLRRRPEDIEALQYYAHARELAEEPNGQHLAETIVALKMLVGLDPDRLDDRRHLLELYARLERRPEAMDTANAILAKHPNDLPTIRIKTDVLMRMGQDRDALAAAEKWAALAPLELKAHMDRIAIRSRLGQSSDVIIADAQKLREAHPGDARFELLQGFAYAQAGDDKQAGQWLKTAAKHKDLPEDVAQQLVTQFDRLGMSDDSLAVMQEIVKGGKSPSMRDALARRYFELSRWNEAFGALATVDPANKASDPTLVAFKAIAAAHLDKKDEVQKCRDGLAGRNQAAAKAWSLLLQRIVDGAKIDNKQVVTECRSALALDPTNIYLDYYMGEANAALGELDLAIESWRRATAANLTWPAPAVRLVEALMQRGQPEQALWVASSAARRGSAQAAVVITMARAWAQGIETGGVGHADELLKLVTEVQRQLPGEDQTLLIRIQLLAQRGGKDKDQAVGLIRTAIQHTPAVSEELLLGLASISQKYAMGLERDCFAKSEQAHGDTPMLAFAEATDASAASNADAGLKIFDELAKKSGHADDQQWRFARARYLDVSGHPDAAKAWKELAAAYPQDLSIQQAVVSARAIRGDWDTIQPAIDRLKTLTGDNGLAWRLAKARLMVESPRNDTDYEQGSVLLDSIIKQYPDLPEPRVLMARALVQMKRVDGAIEQLSVASKLDPTSVPIALQLASLLQSRGDFDRVSQELDRVSPNLHTEAQRRQAAVLLAQQGKADQAAKLLEEKPAASAASPEDTLLLAVLYRQRGQFDKVEASLQTLLAHPTLPAIQFAASYYASRGEVDKAEKALALLDTQKLDPGIKELIWGSYYAQSGNLAKAEEHYRTATTQSPANPVTWRLLAATDVAIGRGQQAMDALSAAANAIPSDQTFKALVARKDVLLQSMADPAARAVTITAIRDPRTASAAMELLGVLSDWRSTGDSERASSQLQQLADKYAAFLPIRLHLIECLASVGRTADAIMEAQQAMAAFPNDPQPARLAVSICASGGKWQEARNAAEAWKKRDPNEAEQADLALARADIGMRDYAAVRNVVQPYLAAALSSPDQNIDMLTAWAIGVTNSGQEPLAAEKLWPLALKSAKWRLRWVQVAIEMQDLQQAASWLDRVAGIMPKSAIGEQVALAEAYARLAESHGDKDLIKKASDVYAGLVQQPNVPAGVLISAAVHAEQRAGDVAAAESLYRRALALDANQWVAQNNLAMLLIRRNSSPAEARAAASAAVRLQPGLATVRDTLAVAEAKAGDQKAAAETMRAAVRLDPDNAQWRIKLAQYLLDAGDRVEASKALAAIDDRRLDLRALPQELQLQLNTIRKGLRSPGT